MSELEPHLRGGDVNRVMIENLINELREHKSSNEKTVTIMFSKLDKIIELQHQDREKIIKIESENNNHEEYLARCESLLEQGVKDYDIQFKRVHGRIDELIDKLKVILVLTTNKGLLRLVTIGFVVTIIAGIVSFTGTMTKVVNIFKPRVEQRGEE